MSTENLPIVEAIVEFLSEDEGGRSLPKGLLTSKQYRYRPHLVIGDRSQHRAIFDRNNRAMEHYLGVQFCDGPEQVLHGVPTKVKMELLYYPQENYEDLVSGAEFTIREGPRIVGHGEVLQWTQKGARCRGREDNLHNEIGEGS